MCARVGPAIGCAPPLVHSCFLLLERLLPCSRPGRRLEINMNHTRAAVCPQFAVAVDDLGKKGDLVMWCGRAASEQ